MPVCGEREMIAGHCYTIRRSKYIGVAIWHLKRKEALYLTWSTNTTGLVVTRRCSTAMVVLIPDFDAAVAVFRSCRSMQTTTAGVRGRPEYQIPTVSLQGELLVVNIAQAQ